MAISHRRSRILLGGVSETLFLPRLEAQSVLV
ncbi:hypothetical protein V6Z11_D05G368700 [Gossypium hirsutum]